MRLFRITLGPIALASTMIFLIGCGSHVTSSPSPSPIQSQPDLTGAWMFADGSHALLAAGVSANHGVLSGTATAYVCAGAAEQTTLSGALTPAGELTLSTAKLNGGTTLIFHGKLSADTKSVEGALAAAGSGCNLQTIGVVTGRVFAPAQGNYSGNFIGSDGASVPVTAMLSQSASAGSGGSYALGGSVTFPNSPCLGTAMIDGAQSSVTGGVLAAVYAATVDQQTVTVHASGTADANATHISITQWTITGGPCDGYSGTGSFTTL